MIRAHPLSTAAAKDGLRRRHVLVAAMRITALAWFAATVSGCAGPHDRTEISPTGQGGVNVKRVGGDSLAQQGAAADDRLAIAPAATPDERGSAIHRRIEELSAQRGRIDRQIEELQTQLSPRR